MTDVCNKTETARVMTQITSYFFDTMDNPDYEKKPSRKSLNYRKRCFGMTGLDRIQVA